MMVADVVVVKDVMEVADVVEVADVEVVLGSGGSRCGGGDYGCVSLIIIYS